MIGVKYSSLPYIIEYIKKLMTYVIIAYHISLNYLINTIKKYANLKKN